MSRGVARLGLLSALVVSVGCGAAQPFPEGPRPAPGPRPLPVAPTSGPAATQTSARATPAASPATWPVRPEPPRWTPAVAAVRGRADVRRGGLRLAVAASVRAAGDRLGVGVEVTITNERRHPVEIGCQPLVFDGKLGTVGDYRSVWDRGSFGEGGPLFVEWGHSRRERVAPGATLVVKRTWPGIPNVYGLQPGDAVRLWLRLSALCLHEVGPRAETGRATRTAVFQREDADVATLTLGVPGGGAKPQLVIESGRRYDASRR